MNLYGFLGQNPINRIDRLGLFNVDGIEVGLGVSATAAVTLGGITVGLETAYTESYVIRGFKGNEVCVTFTITTKIGIGAGELGLSVGLVGGIGDNEFLAPGSATSEGFGIALEDGPGVSGGVSVPTSGGEGYSVGSGDPVGFGIGAGVNAYKSKTYSGKVCEGIYWCDPGGYFALGRARNRSAEAFKLAYEQARKDNFGLPKK